MACKNGFSGSGSCLKVLEAVLEHDECHGLFLWLAELASNHDRSHINFSGGTWSEAVGAFASTFAFLFVWDHRCIISS